ncbi:UNVERIFIED_CONTAM: hypothetical protein Cloal_0917 [Acetivibrio alkalicellulosi]
MKKKKLLITGSLILVLGISIYAFYIINYTFRINNNHIYKVVLIFDDYDAEPKSVSIEDSHEISDVFSGIHKSKKIGDITKCPFRRYKIILYTKKGEIEIFVAGDGCNSYKHELDCYKFPNHINKKIIDLFKTHFGDSVFLY